MRDLQRDFSLPDRGQFGYLLQRVGVRRYGLRFMVTFIRATSTDRDRYPTLPIQRLRHSQVSSYRAGGPNNAFSGRRLSILFQGDPHGNCKAVRGRGLRVAAMGGRPFSIRTMVLFSTPVRRHSYAYTRRIQLLYRLFYLALYGSDGLRVPATVFSYYTVRLNTRRRVHCARGDASRGRHGSSTRGHRTILPSTCLNEGQSRTRVTFRFYTTRSQRLPGSIERPSSAYGAQSTIYTVLQL